ncbi:MAG: sodium:solute symporter [gamma proteobacterium symbiont of Bathyaustriella thionipta]|nr:sodium:solute symporter [gamma proteobacterium symbiont of Bathyaustriella thionipta]MCU7949925.1 sodium:solute symporter [gamma proteobacterium symbiont of Bathyaustriella thionipta]MCU7954189.1 sodium:solute symporter [gamma proteobacterium symbiont of Bathyaustriella thionipta]MCU7956477.1 sodium:solute symporter [gamma proteobacterium symbiont of Bathyaustriella thionipta]MCU7966172.1 sodium:solute symporter [gamma proteobacterium symbiont of Bathyaustriella thionipta]
MSLSFSDLFALIAYLSIVMAIGLYFSRKNTSTEEYFVGGRSFSGWVIGLSLVGTSISSITFLAYPGDAYKTAWIRYLPNLMLPVAIFVAAYVFLPFFRRGNTITAYEYLEHRFGPSIRVYGALTFILGQLVRISLILYLLSLLIHELTGLSPEMSIILGGVFVAVYTIVGGIDAVIWTDVLQTIVLMLGGLFCLTVIITSLPGGLEQILNIATEHGKLAFSELKDGQLVPLEWSFSLQDKTGSMLLLLGLTAWLTEYSANQNTVQRFCASKSDKEARKAMFVCAFTSLPIWAFYMFLGTALYVFFQVFPTETASQILNGEQKAEQILPYFINHYLPSGIAGIVIAAALAAAMSSLDSSINAISTVSIVDIYKRFSCTDKGQEKEDKHYLLVAKLIAVFVSGIMIFGAMLLMNAETKTLQDTATILVSIISGGVLGIYLLGFFTNQGDARAVWSGLILTALFTIWTILAKKELLPDGWILPFDLYYTAIIGNLLMFVVGFIAARFIFQRQSAVGEFSVWGKQ